MAEVGGQDARDPLKGLTAWLRRTLRRSPLVCPSSASNVVDAPGSLAKVRCFAPAMDCGPKSATSRASPSHCRRLPPQAMRPQRVRRVQNLVNTLWSGRGEPETKSTNTTQDT